MAVVSQLHLQINLMNGHFGRIILIPIVPIMLIFSMNVCLVVFTVILCWLLYMHSGKLAYFLILSVQFMYYAILLKLLCCRKAEHIKCLCAVFCRVCVSRELCFHRWIWRCLFFQLIIIKSGNRIRYPLLRLMLWNNDLCRMIHNCLPQLSTTVTDIYHTFSANFNQS